MQLIGDPTGKSVLDVACGEGFYSRMLKQCGATSVTGVDLSVGMIELAIQQEEINQQGIQFLVADAREYNPTEKYDLVIAAYLFNYAHNQQELQAMCDGIARCLNPGGRFITVNCSPFLHFPTAPSYRKYGFDSPLGGRHPYHMAFPFERRRLRARKLSPEPGDARRGFPPGWFQKNSMAQTAVIARRVKASGALILV